MTAARGLVVNADDFGRTPGINRGIVEAHERGIVTSASLMVRHAAAADALERVRPHPGFSVGLHLDLGEWVFRDGAWAALYEVVPLGDAAGVAAEVERQFAEFLRLAGRPPTHVDSHQHVHLHEPVRTAALRAATALGVPLRLVTPHVRHERGFYGCTGEGEPRPEFISPDNLRRLIGTVPPGLTELGCHPGHAHDLDAPYRDERSVELASLCDPTVRSTLRDPRIRLRSFHDARCPPGTRCALAD